MMLKIADLTDLPDLKRMALLFKVNSPYTDHLTDEDKVEETIKGLLSSDSKDAIVLLAIEDFKTVGMVAGIAREFIFSRERHATEIVWWVDVEHRKGPGQKLQEAFVYWAQKVGCKYLHMTLLQNKDAPKLKKLYKQLGFKLMEQAWIKEI